MLKTLGGNTVMVMRHGQRMSGPSVALIGNASVHSATLGYSTVILHLAMTYCYFHVVVGATKWLYSFNVQLTLGAATFLSLQNCHNIFLPTAPK